MISSANDDSGGGSGRRNVFIVEDHAGLRRNLAVFICTRSDLQCVGTAANGREALEMIPQCPESPDIILADLAMPEMDGLQLVREITRRGWSYPCLILSAHWHEGYVLQAVKAGAQGYLFKGRPEEIRPAIDSVLEGERYFSEEIDLERFL